MQKTIGRIDKKDTKTGKKADGSEWKNFSFRIGGKFYSTFDTKLDKFDEGDNVKVEFEVDGRFNNIKSMEATTETATPTPNVPNNSATNNYCRKPEQIIRTSALEQANALLENCIKLDPGDHDLKDKASGMKFVVNAMEMFEKLITNGDYKVV